MRLHAVRVSCRNTRYHHSVQRRRWSHQPPASIDRPHSVPLGGMSGTMNELVIRVPPVVLRPLRRASRTPRLHRRRGVERDRARRRSQRDLGRPLGATLPAFSSRPGDVPGPVDRRPSSPRIDGVHRCARLRPGREGLRPEVGAVADTLRIRTFSLVGGKPPRLTEETPCRLTTSHSRGRFVPHWSP